MIETLTREQIAKFPEYVEKWKKIGLSTERIDRPQAVEHMKLFYRDILKYEGDKCLFVFMDDPIMTWCAVVLLYNAFYNKDGTKKPQQVRQQVEQQVWQQVEQQVEQQVRQQVGQQVGKQVGKQVEQQVEWQVEQQVEQQVWQQVEQQVRQQVERQVEQQVWQQVRQQVEQQVGQQVWQQVWQQVRQQVGKQVRQQVPDIVFPYQYGHFESGYFSFYDFCKEVLKLDFLPAWETYKKTTDYEFQYCFPEFCVICEKPIKMLFNPRGQLHNVSATALEYNSGWGLWMLNGVNVGEKIVMTPAEKLDPQMILKEQNAEVRRELVRKIGIERVCAKLGAKVVDTWNGYELLELDVAGRKYTYLKMKNPSIGTYHLEGVQAKTVREALEYRKPAAMRAIPQAENGEEWAQQGDVCIWPAEAKYLKPLPTILT